MLRRFISALVWRYCIVYVLVSCCYLATAESGQCADGLTLEYRGKVRVDVDRTVDQDGKAFQIVGLSGITNLGNDRYASVMDNSNHVVALKITCKDDGTIAAATVLGGLTVPTSRDYEGIAYTNPTRHSVFLSNEATPPPPALYEYNLKTGALMQTVAMPTVFNHQVDNRGLESLTRRPDGKEMWTANEEALTADGPLSTISTGTMVRLVRFVVNGDSVQPAEQYAYNVEPIHTGLGKPYSSGLSDLCELTDGMLLTLERSAIEGLPVFETRIYQVDFSGATDVSRGALADGLIGQSYLPVKKTLLLKSVKIGENLEGLCLGPKLPNGNQVLLGVVDSGDPISKNTVVAFELIAPTPLPMGMILGGAGGALVAVVTVATLARRKKS